MRILIDTAESLWKVFLIGLLLGAGLPTVFALGIRLLAPRLVRADGTEQPVGSAARVAAGWTAIAVVVVAIVTGILYVTKDFLAQNLGIHLF